MQHLNRIKNISGMDFQSIYQILVCFLSITLVSCSENKVSHDGDHLIYGPARGEIIYTGTTYKIHWALPSWSLIDIELLGSTGRVLMIEKALPNRGSYLWRIPVEIPSGTDYTIGICNAEDPASGMMGGSFELRAKGEMSSFTDLRDGQTYKTVQIGTQWWMAEDFNFPCDGSHFYQNRESDGAVCGRLYTLEAAINHSPPGWHLPADDEWKQLEAYLGIRDDDLDEFGERGRYAGLLLGKN